MEFLCKLKVPNRDKLSVGENASCNTSGTSANDDMLESLVAVIRKDMDNKLRRSPFVSILADESTDIGMDKKLVVYARVLDSDTFTAHTHFLQNVKLSNGSGQVVSQAIYDCLQSRNIPISKVIMFSIFYCCPPKN